MQVQLSYAWCSSLDIDELQSLDDQLKLKFVAATQVWSLNYRSHQSRYIQLLDGIQRIRTESLEACHHVEYNGWTLCKRGNRQISLQGLVIDTLYLFAAYRTMANILQLRLAVFSIHSALLYSFIIVYRTIHSFIDTIIQSGLHCFLPHAGRRMRSTHLVLLVDELGSREQLDWFFHLHSNPVMTARSHINK